MKELQKAIMSYKLNFMILNMPKILVNHKKIDAKASGFMFFSFGHFVPTRLSFN